MVIFLLPTVIILCYSTLPVDGQCAFSSTEDDSESGFDEYVFNILMELGPQLTTLQERVSSLDRCETVHPLSIEKIEEHCRGNPSLCDCSSIRANGFRTSGVYRVYAEHQHQRYYFDVYCDMTTTPNIGWTVFQRRKDGSEDFYRGWDEYANGFGNPQGEFWLGNDFLHYVTSKRRYILRIELEEFEGEKRYAEYLLFNISSATDKYKLTIGSYRGDAGDSLIYHNGSKFSTHDQNNAKNPHGNCPVTRRGAWWYVYCHYSNLNGLYYSYGNYSNSRNISGNGIEWFYWRNIFGISLKTTEMKLAPI